MASIKIPTPLRAYTGGNALVTVGGETVGAILDDLTRQYPELRGHLFEGDKLRSFVNIFIGSEDVRFRDGLETPVGAEDELRIIPSIAGGSDGTAR
jgi:molybdopterin converting factor small subunit